jgi:very-short-patch-repair endonuclease
VDFLIEHTNKVIEVLSRRYHGSLLDRLSDDSRISRLNEAGFVVLTLWDSDVWANGDLVRDRIEAFWRDDLTPEGQIVAPKWF